MGWTGALWPVCLSPEAESCGGGGDRSTHAGGHRRGRSHLTARMTVFTAGMMSSKVRSQWELFSSPLSSGGQSAVGARAGGSQRPRAVPMCPPKPLQPPRNPTAGPGPHQSPGFTLDRGPWLEPEGCTEPGPVVEAPALLHLGGAGSLGDVLSAGGAVQGGPQVLPAPAALPLRAAQPDAVLDAHLVAAWDSGMGRVRGERAPGGTRMGTGRALLGAHMVPTPPRRG